MTGVRLLAPLALAAVLTVTAATWWFGGRADQPTLATASTEAVEQAADDNNVQGLPALEPDEGLRAEDVWAHLNDPANSDLPPEVFAATSQLAADVVRADATGEGRDRWPAYWAGAVDAGRAAPCCTRVEVHAAGADRAQTPAEQVSAVVIWSGWSARGEVVSQATTVVVLAKEGSWWRPIRSR